MKHENMLDGIGLFEHSLDETWKHVGWSWTIWTLFGWNMKACWMVLNYVNILWTKHENMLDGVELFEHSLDETWKLVELDNMDEIYYVNWNMYMDENDKFDVYKTFDMDEVQKTWNDVAMV